MAYFFSRPPPEKLNICIVTKKLPYPGRDETYLWPLARGISKRGHKVTVLSGRNPRGRSEIISDRVKAYFLSDTKNTSFAQLVQKKFEELHAKEPFHIVHSLDDSAFNIGYYRKYYGVVTTFDVSATQMAQIFSILGMAQETLGSLLATAFALVYKFLTTFFSTDRKILRSADGVFVATPMQRIILERYYLYPEMSTYIIPYGMDYIETELVEKNEEFKTRLGLPIASHVILTYTDMNELGEVLNILRAFQRVVVKKPNTRLVILGNGPLKNQIEFEVLSLVLGSKVVLAGAIPGAEITNYIALSDIYVNLSSRTTGFEPIMLESMAQKKVVIGSELSPISTIITDGVDGFLLRPADVNALTDLMAALFSGHFKSREAGKTVEEIGEHAREKVLSLFDIDKMVDNMLGAFYDTLRRTNRRVAQVKTTDATLREPPNPTL